MEYSKLLISPNKGEFFLNDEEITLLKEARFSFMGKNYQKTLSFIWDTIISNLIRRISEYGTETFLHNLSIEEKNVYLKDTKEDTHKINLLNNTILIKNCLKLNIINAKTFAILDFFYTFLKNSDLALLEKEEVNSCLILLELNLFKIPIEKNYTNIVSSQSNKIEKIEDDYLTLQKKEEKQLKKEDILLMHYINNSDKELHPILEPNDTPKRRKEDRVQSYSSINIPIEETKSKKFFHRRRKEDK